jgi:hypothetical protein
VTAFCVNANIRFTGSRLGTAYLNFPTQPSAAFHTEPGSVQPRKS